MTKPQDVLTFLIPNGGWTMKGDQFSGVQFLDCEPITEQQFNEGFAKLEKSKIEQESQRIAEKAALLAKLGISESEAALLLS